MATPPRASLFGYRGLTQPSAELTLTLPLPEPLDLTRIDQRLATLFAVTAQPLVTVDNFKGGIAEKKVAQLAWRILLLGGSLLRAVKVPALDPGAVVTVRPAGNNGRAYTVAVAIPVVEQLPGRFLRQAYEQATRVLLTLAARGTGAGDAALQDGVAREFVTPLEEQIPGGRSTIPLLSAAHRAGIPFRHLGSGIYQLGWGCHATLLDRSSIQADSAIGSKMSNHKYLAAAVVRAAGLPAPEHRMVASVAEAVDAAHQLGWPVVVKPADRDRGEGVTVDIRDDDTLANAYHHAAGLSRAILVERQAPGVCHRLYVSHGKLLFAVKRLPKSVTGDGVHTVAQLIDQANSAEQAKPPWSRLKPFPIDTMAVENLAAAGLTPDSVPAPGQYAPLRSIQSTAWGGVVEDVTAIIHPDNVALAVRAAALFGLSSAGIDCISADIREPWHSNGAIVNEVNFSPLLTDEAVAGAHLPTFIAALVKGDGRIPVELFVGGPAGFDRARARQQSLVAEGVACHLTSHLRTLSPTGEELALAGDGLMARGTALLMDRAVEHLILVVHTDELLHSGLPVDRIAALTLVDEQLMAWQGEGAPLSAQGRAGLRRLLRGYRLQASGS